MLVTIATHCNTLQYTATHCTTLQHSATVHAFHFCTPLHICTVYMPYRAFIHEYVDLSSLFLLRPFYFRCICPIRAFIHDCM